MAMFLPSSYPRSRSPWRRASSRAAFTAWVLETSTPIFQVFTGCCALATTAPPSSPTTTPTTLTKFFIHDALDICFLSPDAHCADFRFPILRLRSVHVLDFRLADHLITLSAR